MSQRQYQKQSSRDDDEEAINIVYVMYVSNTKAKELHSQSSISPVTSLLFETGQENTLLIYNENETKPKRTQKYFRYNYFHVNIII